MQKLPIGEQFFKSLREKNKVYVDKTRQIYDLLHTGRFVFHSRPRRFGKSLLTTTLRQIFRTNLGRIDAVLALPEAVYILEFKMSTAKVALKQIRDKKYDLPYRNQDKPILLLGIASDEASRNIAE